LDITGFVFQEGVLTGEFFWNKRARRGYGGGVCIE
jgi:hypothetical protein